MRVAESRHRKSEVKTLGRGFPDTLQVFRMPASKFWYVGMYSSSAGRFVRKSTGCDNLNDAKEFAANWYEERIVERRTQKLGHSESFGAFAAKFQDTQRREIKRGQLSEDMLYHDNLRLQKDMLPKFGVVHISNIDYTLVDNHLDELKSDRDLSQSSLKQQVVLIRKVLKEAERDGTLNHIPTLPIVKRIENPRAWFSPEEYLELLAACRDLRENPPPKLQNHFAEMYDFIVFMIHTFLRPSEWTLLQNKHIRILKDDGIDQLVISVPNSKTRTSKGSIDSTTTEIAADVYKKRILPRHDGRNDRGRN